MGETTDLPLLGIGRGAPSISMAEDVSVISISPLSLTGPRNLCGSGNFEEWRQNPLRKRVLGVAVRGRKLTDGVWETRNLS